LKSFVIEYVRERGNNDSSEVLDDYMEYLHSLGYVIHHKNRRKAHTDLVPIAQKPLIVHLLDPPVPTPELVKDVIQDVLHPDTEMMD
jgi:hypothetical protein